MLFLKANVIIILKGIFSELTISVESPYMQKHTYFFFVFLLYWFLIHMWIFFWHKKLSDTFREKKNWNDSWLALISNNLLHLCYHCVILNDLKGKNLRNLMLWRVRDVSATSEHKINYMIGGGENRALWAEWLFEP